MTSQQIQPWFVSCAYLWLLRHVIILIWVFGGSRYLALSLGLAIIRSGSQSRTVCTV